VAVAVAVCLVTGDLCAWLWLRRCQLSGCGCGGVPGDNGCVPGDSLVVVVARCQLCGCVAVAVCLVTVAVCLVTALWLW
jgi:hypothetical protein